MEAIQTLIFCISSWQINQWSMWQSSHMVMIVQHGNRYMQDDISNECQKKEKRRFYGLSKNLKRPNHFNYLLHICFDSLSGT